MNRGFSLWLDAARVTAALVVLVSHFAYGWASGGGLLWIRELNLGSDAVVVFFVLSGLVIAHTANTKDHTLGAFALSRLSRLYSVAIPALLLSFACAWTALSINPAAFIAGSPVDANFGADDMPEQLLRGLTFTNYVWWDAQRIAANGPFWSVSYEFWYYVLFGAGMFLRGRIRVWTIALVCLLVGPPVLLLAPCWLIGVAVQKALATGFAADLSRGRAWRFAVLPLPIYAALLAIGAPEVLTAFTRQVLGGVSPAVFFFSDEFIWNFVLAILVAVHFLGMARLLASGSQALERAATAIRWIAGRTFSLYLFHMPIMKLGAALPGYDPGNPLHAAALLAGVVTACLLLAECTERRLPEWRGVILRYGDLAGRALRIRPRAA